MREHTPKRGRISASLSRAGRRTTYGLYAIFEQLLFWCFVALRDTPLIGVEASLTDRKARKLKSRYNNGGSAVKNIGDPPRSLLCPSRSPSAYCGSSSPLSCSLTREASIDTLRFLIADRRFGNCSQAVGIMRIQCMARWQWELTKGCLLLDML